MPTKKPPQTKFQLGQRVRFQRVVSPRTTKNGQPVIQKLTTPRTGTVIARRNVYDRVPGSQPPVLINPREVYLIAVTLHRHYRVLPDDIKA